MLQVSTRSLIVSSDGKASNRFVKARVFVSKSCCDAVSAAIVVIQFSVWTVIAQADIFKESTIYWDAIRALSTIDFAVSKSDMVV